MKRLICLVLCVLSFCLAACSKGDKNNGDTNVNATEESTTIATTIDVVNLPFNAGTMVSLGEYKNLKITFANENKLSSEAYDNAIIDEAWKIIMNNSDINCIPQSIFEAIDLKLNNIIKEHENLASTKYKMTFEEYLRGIGYADRDEFNADLELYGHKLIKQQMLVLAIAEYENITVSQDEITAEINNYMNTYKCEKEEDLEKHLGKNYKQDIELSLLINKVGQTLLQSTTVTS